MKLFLKLLILLVGLLLPVIAFARDNELPQIIDLGDQYSISLPTDWSVLRGSNQIFTARSSEITLTILTPTYLDTLSLNITDKSNVVDGLITLYALPPKNGNASRSDVQKTLYGDRLAAVYTNLNDSDKDEMDVVVTMSSGAPGYLIFVANKGQLTLQRPIINAIITSFDIASSSGTSESGSADSNAGVGGATSGDAVGVNCTVSADSADAAQLRVGPGTNRGAISFLPTNVQVTVTGRIVLNDKSVWYQLDKAEAAPKGTAAAELWVAATSVTTTGDCDHVGDANAPPVIPGNVAPPPTNDSQGNNPPQGNPSNTAPGALPTPGRWTIAYNPTTNVSCQGTPNLPVDSTQVFASLTYTFFVDGVDANSFRYAGDLFTRVPGTNSFNGSFTNEDGSNVQERYDVISATFISGQAVGNVVIDGTPCSATVLLTVTRQ